MVHFTNKDIMKKRHYWRLDSKSITMFKVKEHIQLRECAIPPPALLSATRLLVDVESKFRGWLCIFLS